MATIATHNGSTVHQAHNVRQANVVSKEEHINPNGVHETWVHEPVRQAYQRLFGEAVQRYNETQTRDDRKISSYYNKIRNSQTQHPAYEMIIGIYGKDENGVYECSEAAGRQIMKEFVDGWKERNPNLELVGAYYHADEQGEPHVHIDYVPVAHGYTKGMDTQAGLVKALSEMGFKKQGRLTAQMQWQARENAELDRICMQHGIEVEHPRKEHAKHLDTQTYKAEKALSKAVDDKTHLEEEIKGLQGKIQGLEAVVLDRKAMTDLLKGLNPAIKNAGKIAEQVLKGDLELKKPLFSKNNYEVSLGSVQSASWELERKLEALKPVINTIEDVGKKLSYMLENHNQLIENRVQEIVRETQSQLLRDAQKAKEDSQKAENDRMQAEESKRQQERHIKDAAKEEADRMFKEFMDKDLAKETKGRGARLEKFCTEVKFENGSSVLDAFEQAEEERKQRLEQSWQQQRQ